MFFLRKVRAEWLPLCRVFGYCLTPNDFRFLLVPNQIACLNLTIKEKESHLQIFSKAIGKTLSSYAAAINIEQNRIGTLFQKKTRARHITKKKLSVISMEEYLRNILREIHERPLQRGLVIGFNDWPFSSSRSYSGLVNDELVDKRLFHELTGVLKVKEEIQDSSKKNRGLANTQKASGPYSGLTLFAI